MENIRKPLLLLAFCALVVKACVKDISLSDALMFLSICGLVALDNFILLKTPSAPSEQLKTDIEKLKSDMSHIKLASMRRQ